MGPATTAYTDQRRAASSNMAGRRSEGWTAAAPARLPLHPPVEPLLLLRGEHGAHRGLEIALFLLGASRNVPLKRFHPRPPRIEDRANPGFLFRRQVQFASEPLDQDPPPATGRASACSGGPDGHAAVTP